jgi:hypothetical protein
MGRKITDGNAVDVTAPGSTHVEMGELYRIDGWSGFAMDDISATATDRGLALEVTHSLWRIKTPSGTAATRGDFLKWATGAGFKAGPTDLQDVAAPAAGGVPALAVAKVEGVRNSGGYATVRLTDGG